jgi:hypothetical protein
MARFALDIPIPAGRQSKMNPVSDAITAGVELCNFGEAGPRVLLAAM